MSDSKVIDGNTASDAEVARALGLTAPAEETDTGSDDESRHEGDAPDAFDDLPEWAQSQIKQLRKEMSDLKYEAGRRRIEAREASKAAKGAEVSPKDLKAAEERGREAARMEYGVRLAGAEVRASLADVVPNDQINSFVTNLDLARFVDEDGGVDQDLIKELREQVVSLLGTRKTPRVNHGSTSKPGQKSKADMLGEVLFR